MATLTLKVTDNLTPVLTDISDRLKRADAHDGRLPGCGGRGVLTAPEPAAIPATIWNCLEDDPQDVADWLVGAVAGERLFYHRGFLAVDAWNTGTAGGRALAVAARVLVAAAGIGRVHLVQARAVDGLFDYIAERRAAP